MKLTRYIALAILAISSNSIGAAKQSQSTPAQTAVGTQSQSQPGAQLSPAPSDELKAVLARMNEGANNFRSFQADADWENFESLVKETTIEKGKAYFRRKRSARKSEANKSEMEALFNFNSTKPEDKGALVKQVLYKDAKIQLYEVRINRITERPVGKNKSDVDAFMSLGLGGRGDDLGRSFNLNWRGWEMVDGVKTAKLEVTGKTPTIQKVFSKAVLWIDPERDIAIKQQFFTGGEGDYRLTHYSNINCCSGKVSDNVFRLQTTGKPEIVRLHAD